MRHARTSRTGQNLSRNHSQTTAGTESRSRSTRRRGREEGGKGWRGGSGVSEGEGLLNTGVLMGTRVVGRPRGGGGSGGGSKK